MKLQDVAEGKKNAATKAVKIWLKISDLFVDLEDELLEIADTNPHAEKALAHLRNNDLQELHLELKRIFV